MNYYERIQKSIDYIEGNLQNEINIEQAATEAYMSCSNYYRLFFALTGHTVKEYIRQRRITLAVGSLKESKHNILDLALMYGFESNEAFTRAFKRVTGNPPSAFRKTELKFSFERVDILDKYFDIQDQKLLKKYPDIKVLKKLEPVRVAYYCYNGKSPEFNAFAVMREWIGKTGLDLNRHKLRIFGYDNPSPSSPKQTEYGYEVCVTIAEDLIVADDKVKTKILAGGLYAVTGVKRGPDGDIGKEIMKTWARFRKWLQDSKYVYGGHQWLEEHLGFDDDFNHIGGVDLYLPIIERTEIDTTKTFTDVAPMWTATYTATGKDAINQGREYFITWAEREGLLNELNAHRFFSYYNHEREGHDDFFYKIQVTVNKDFSTSDPKIVLEQFPGGRYAIMKSKAKYNRWSWGEFINWVKKSKEYDFGNWWFFQEYLIKTPAIKMETEMILYMPIKQKDTPS